VAQHPPDHRLTTTTQGPGLHNNPLGVRRWIGIGEAADLAFLIIHQPTHAILWRMAVNKWAVSIRHQPTMAD
jgi:hypothetical protein